MEELHKEEEEEEVCCCCSCWLLQLLRVRFVFNDSLGVRIGLIAFGCGAKSAQHGLGKLPVVVHKHTHTRTLLSISIVFASHTKNQHTPTLHFLRFLSHVLFLTPSLSVSH